MTGNTDMDESWWLNLIRNPKVYVNAWNETIRQLWADGKITWINSRWRIA